MNEEMKARAKKMLEGFTTEEALRRLIDAAASLFGATRGEANYGKTWWVTSWPKGIKPYAEVLAEARERTEAALEHAGLLFVRDELERALEKEADQPAVVLPPR